MWRGLVLLIVIFSIFQPVTAGENEVYTAVTSISYKSLYYEKPETTYPIDITFQVWSERNFVDLRPSTLGIEENTCLFTANITTTNFLPSASFCLLESISRSTAYSSLGTVFSEGVTNSSSGWWYLLRVDGITVNNSDPRTEVFPDGQVRIRIEPHPSLEGIVGTMYNATIFTTYPFSEVLYDRLPANYGQTTDNEEDYFHVRIIEFEPGTPSANPTESTTYTFDVDIEVLNTGDSFIHEFPDDCVVVLYEKDDFANETYATSPFGRGCSFTGTPYLFPARTTLVYSTTYSIYFRDVILHTIPEGDVTLFVGAGQPFNNSINATISYNGTNWLYEYQERPDFWDDFPRIDGYAYDFRPPRPTSSRTTTSSPSSTVPTQSEEGRLTQNMMIASMMIILGLGSKILKRNVEVGQN